MLENVLEKRKTSLKIKISVKSAVSAALIVLAVVLPQIAHLAVGASAGMTLLPMYLPVLMGGLLLGTKWGLIVGILSPVASFCITSLAGAAMPAASRLPFMMAELAVFAAVSGLFGSKISEKPLLAFVGVILAQVCGRAFFLLCVYAFRGLSPLTVAAVWGQIKTGFTGLAIQAVAVPVIAIVISKLLNKEQSK